MVVCGFIATQGILCVGWKMAEKKYKLQPWMDKVRVGTIVMVVVNFGYWMQVVSKISESAQ